MIDMNHRTAYKIMETRGKLNNLIYKQCFHDTYLEIQKNVWDWRYHNIINECEKELNDFT
jgi:hypothetical protein